MLLRRLVDFNSVVPQVDDDYVWGGGDNLHGLYHPSHTAESIVLDFLCFCKLAAWRQLVPRGWNWEKCLVTAGDMLTFAFEKSDAQEEYGSENVFSAITGSGRSLRFTAEVRALQYLTKKPLLLLICSTTHICSYSCISF